MSTTIWAASAVTPAGTDRIPVDVSGAGGPSRWTGQQVADVNTLIGGTVTALGSIGTNTAINLALGGYFSATITGNLTFSITNVPASAGVTFVLALTNGGAFTVTLPGSVTIIGGSPVLSAAGTDWLVFRTIDGGTAWTLEVVGNPRDADLATWATITPGTGVGTALAVNTGTAGAVVVNGGALGTPSSGTLTNATGLPPAGITQSGATSNQVLTWNGSAWAPATPSAGSPAGSSGQMQYNNASAFGAANLWRESADIIALRNSTTAQAFRVFDTYTDGSNGAYLELNPGAAGDWVQVRAVTVGTAGDNYGIALTPTGTGAISAHVPDSATAGGNARGSNAVDLQTAARTLATQVASGVGSVLSGGERNIASGNYSSVGGGYNNTASGSHSRAGGGQAVSVSGSWATGAGGSSNTVSGDKSVVSGGESNAASTTGATVSGGMSNTADGIRSWVPGGYQATTRALTGAYAYSAGRRSANGDAQVIGQPVRRTTTDATPVSLATDGTPAATTVMVIPSESVAVCRASVVALNTAAGVISGAGFEITALVKNDSGTTALLGAATTTAIGTADAALTTATCTLIANNTLDSVEIQVTGVAATTIHWVGKLELVQVL